MFKKLFMVALFMVLSITAFTSVAKADAYEYENIQEFTDQVSSVINKKSSYNFKYTFRRNDYQMDLDTNINWKKMTVTFNGWVARPENRFEPEKFSAVLNLRNNKVKTSSKAYKKGRNTLSELIALWNCKKDSEYSKSLGHYLLSLFEITGRFTTIDKSEDTITIRQDYDDNGTMSYSLAVIDKSKLLKLEIRDEPSIISIKLK